MAVRKPPGQTTLQATLVGISTASLGLESKRDAAENTQIHLPCCALRLSHGEPEPGFFARGSSRMKTISTQHVCHFASAVEWNSPQNAEIQPKQKHWPTSDSLPWCPQLLTLITSLALKTSSRRWRQQTNKRWNWTRGSLPAEVRRPIVWDSQQGIDWRSTRFEKNFRGKGAL